MISVAGKARGGRISLICNRRATQPAAERAPESCGELLGRDPRSLRGGDERLALPLTSRAYDLEEGRIGEIGVGQIARSTQGRPQPQESLFGIGAGDETGALGPADLRDRPIEKPHSHEPKLTRSDGRREKVGE